MPKKISNIVQFTLKTFMGTCQCRSDNLGLYALDWSGIQ